jgi:hypothetical protein
LNIFVAPNPRPTRFVYENKGRINFVKVLPWDPFATFNVAVLIHSFVHIGVPSARRFYFFDNDSSAFFKFESKTLFSI